MQHPLKTDPPHTNNCEQAHAGDLTRLQAEIERYRQGQITSRTAYDYNYDWRAFQTWCGKMQREAFPATPETLALYVADLLDRGKKVSTVARYAAGVVYYHSTHGVESPLTPQVRAILAGARQIRCEQLHQMKPFTPEDIRLMTAVLREDNSDRAIRDASILTLGFASALRRSNLAWMRFEDLEWCADGIRIHIRREKQDRTREGRMLGITYGNSDTTCPVRSLDRWLDIRGRGNGPLYNRLDPGRTGPLQPLTPSAILCVVKRVVKRCYGGVGPCPYGSHSMRAGFITAAGRAGVPHLLIAKHSGHKSLDVLNRYFRPDEVFRDNPLKKIDL